MFFLRQKSSKQVKLAHLRAINAAVIVDDFFHEAFKLFLADASEIAEEKRVEQLAFHVGRGVGPQRQFRHDRVSRQTNGRQTCAD